MKIIKVVFMKKNFQLFLRVSKMKPMFQDMIKMQYNHLLIFKNHFVSLYICVRTHTDRNTWTDIIVKTFLFFL